MKKHIISLYTIVVILLISQVFTMYMLIIRTTQLSNDLNQTYTQVNAEIKSNQIETLGKINEISESLKTTQTSLTRQLSELKASASSDFSGIIEQAIPSVVTIKTDVGQGTGFIINSEGYIVTNAHVLSNAHYATAITSTRQSKSAQLIGYDSEIDLALLKIPGSYDAISLGDSDDVKPGEKVIAIGNPLGLSFSATEGIISAVDRRGSNNLPIYIQTDVALNPGNSGGPLINKQGKVIGINNFKVGGYEGLGFALESNQVKETVDKISLQVLNQTII